MQQQRVYHPITNEHDPLVGVTSTMITLLLLEPQMTMHFDWPCIPCFNVTEDMPN
jgi:hypothetical protein